MFDKIINKSIPLPDGRQITIESGKMARQADGSVTVRLGDAILLATVVATKDPRPGVDFLPLSVDYQEKFGALGRIPGSFQRREGRLSDREVLISRLVDRALRPMFPDDYHADIQVNIILISADLSVQPDALACLAAAAALAVSDIPFNGPVSEVRVARHNGQLHINPASEILDEADIDLIVAGSDENILMVEGEMDEVSEKDMLDAIIHAHQAIRVQCAVLKEMTEMAGKTEKRTYSHETHNDDLRKRVQEALYKGYHEAAGRGIANKAERRDAFKTVKEAFLATLTEEELTSDVASMISGYSKEVEKKAMRDAILDKKVRLDGRRTDEIRQIVCEIDLLPGAHGSALFTRGETQSLTTVTLGTKLDEQIVDQTMYKGYSKFLLHYNFPGFSTGEVKPNRGPGRREIGHGNLAARSIQKVMPDEEKNPYTIRIVSDILESNGSSSMATVCAATLALMDAGIKIKAPVSGIAMGLITDSESGRYAVLSDILGDEDHLGDMDFKVTGTAKGITACQMDLKVDGLPYEVLQEALEQAKAGRMHILNVMLSTISEVRADLKPHAPRSTTMFIEREFIGAVIGPGGKIIQEITRTTGATINIEEVGNQGVISIFAVEKTAMDAAVNWIKGIVAIPEVGGEYVGKVKNIQPFGAFIEFMPGKEGLLHISEIKYERLPTMEGVLEIGEEVKVKLLEVDKKTGKFRLSRKALLPKPEGWVEPEDRGERRDRGDRDRGDRGGRDRDRGGDRGPRGDRRERSGDRDERGGNGHEHHSEAPETTENL